MVRYYENLLAGQGRVEAMRETADWMRRWRTLAEFGGNSHLLAVRA